MWLLDYESILNGNIRVVVLNACYAKDQAQALATAIDFTIGMNAAIKDKDATTFAAHFLSIARVWPLSERRL